MASGSFDLSYSKSAFRGRIAWSSTPNQDSNSSTVRASLYLWKTDGYPTSGTFSGSVAAGTSEQSFQQYMSLKDEVMVVSTSVTVKHDSDGNGTCYISGAAYGPTGTSLSGSSVSGGQTVTLDKIEVAGPSEITVPASAQMGKKMLISIARDKEDCIHTLSYTFGGSTVELATNVESSYTWDIPDLASLCSDATYGNCEITCKTYRKNKLLGQTVGIVKLNVQDPTTPSVSGGEFTMGSTGIISCPRNSQNFTLRLEYDFKSVTGVIQDGQIESAEWTPPYDLAKEIPSLTYGTGTIRCITLNGTAEVGSRETTIRLFVPENEVTRPQFTSDGLKLYPVGDLSQDFAGMYMRGKTGVRAEFTASSDYSTIRSYSIIVGSLSAEGNPALVDLLVDDGEVKVVAKVTDARGYSTTVTTSIYIIPYRRPKVTPYIGYDMVICDRALETGELSSNGTLLAIRAGRSYSSVKIDGVEKNRCTLRYRWKTTNAAEYGQWVTLISPDSEKTEVSLLIADVVSSISTSYDIQISAVDDIGSEHILSFPIMTDAVSFVLYDGVDGAGFGKYPESPHVIDIASHMTLLVRGKLIALSSAWVSLNLADGVEESVYAYGRKEDTGCHYQISNGNHVYTAFNCGFHFNGVPVVINKDPLPESIRPKRPVFSLCPINDRGIAMVSANPDGYIQVEWAQRMTDVVMTGDMEVVWIDGYLDYWTS